MKAKTPISRVITVSLLTILAKIGGIFKVSLIFGSFAAFFSASSMIQPLTGAFGGVYGSYIAFSFGMLLRLVLGTGFGFKILVYHIPGLFASLYLANQSRLLSLGVPILCIIAFVMHPIGAQVAPYALYWLIPIALSFVHNKTLFTRTLTSTFIAHAVGSVIWLYASSTSPTFWYALLPIVAVERLVFASGMVLVYRLIEWVQAKLSQVKFRIIDVKSN